VAPAAVRRLTRTAASPHPSPLARPSGAGSAPAERRPWPHRPTGRPPVGNGGGTAQAARQRAAPARERGGNNVAGNKGAAGRLEGQTTHWHWYSRADRPCGTAGGRRADGHGGATSRGRRPGGSSRYAAFLVGRRAQRGQSGPNGHGSPLSSYNMSMRWEWKRNTRDACEVHPGKSSSAPASSPCL